MNHASWLNPLFALLLSPLLFGVINRTKALFAGRNGPPLLQPYYDLWKLMHKGAVYSRTTTWVFRLSPAAGLAAVLLASALVPLGGVSAPLSFEGDLILLAYLLGLMRFLTVIAALDTGSSFEGMGASREVWFSALVEPVLFLALAALARETGSLSLSGMLGGASTGLWGMLGSILVLVVLALFVILLTENCRIPVDDPNTHLELTMIHEVMVLDYSGPDFAFIQYGAMLKLWVLGTLVAGLVIPLREIHPLLSHATFLAGMMGVAVAVGAVESSMARLRLIRVPHLLTGAGVLAAVALVLSLR